MEVWGAQGHTGERIRFCQTYVGVSALRLLSQPLPGGSDAREEDRRRVGSSDLNSFRPCLCKLLRAGKQSPTCHMVTFTGIRARTFWGSNDRLVAQSPPVPTLGAGKSFPIPRVRTCASRWCPPHTRIPCKTPPCASLCLILHMLGHPRVTSPRNS